MHIRIIAWGLFAVSCAGLPAGCKHCCRRAAPAAVAYAPVPPCAPAVAVVPGRVAPAALPPAPLPPGPIQAGVRQYPPAVVLAPDPTWRPAPERGDFRLQLPPGENREPPAPLPVAPPPPSPAVAEERAATAPLPVGIPQFAPARDKVATGLKPLLDGLDWLQANGYRAVLHLRPPGEDDSADRKQVEKRGMKYLSLEVSPQTLSRAVVDEFNRQVRDPAHQPLFVYDRDGVLAGGLWYLHYRTADGLTDEEARARAGRVGLREDQDEGRRTLWLAIQKLLSEMR
jgi:protein tyrosine phosphatase (PTP) superfamily phosphohydrolase (DUF442 family)